MSPHALYIGRSADRLERLLGDPNPIPVTAAPSVGAAIDSLSVDKLACLVWDIDPDPDADLGRLFSIATDVPIVVPGSRTFPDGLDRHVPSVTRTDDESLSEVVRERIVPDRAVTSPPAVANSRLGQTTDRVARADRAGTQCSASDGLPSLLEGPSGTLVDTPASEATAISFVFDSGETLLQWNDRLTEATGYTDEEIREMHPLDLVEPDDVPRVLDAIERVWTERQPVSVEATLVGEDGSRIPYEFTGFVIENTDEPANDLPARDGYVRVTGRDVSRRVTTECERDRAIEELERSNAELERFAYVTSHDFKEPLRMIRSYLELIQRRHEGALDEDTDEFISYAVDGAERLRRMIDDLLIYSRIGTTDLTVRSIDCNDVLDRVLASLRSSIEEENAQITVDALPTVEGDERQLGRLFENLISNAIAYSGDSPPTIHVSATRLEDMWRFTVADDGIGIETDDVEDVFEVFSSGTVSRGTGMGLAICEQIARRHDGEIWVESDLGAGSTFYVTLPNAIRPDPDSADV